MTTPVLAGSSQKSQVSFGNIMETWSWIFTLSGLIADLLRCIMDESRGVVLRGSRKPRRASPRIRFGSPRTGAGVCARLG